MIAVDENLACTERIVLPQLTNIDHLAGSNHRTVNVSDDVVNCIPVDGETHGVNVQGQSCKHRQQVAPCECVKVTIETQIEKEQWILILRHLSQSIWSSSLRNLVTSSLVHHYSFPFNDLTFIRYQAVICC